MQTPIKLTTADEVIEGASRFDARPVQPRRIDDHDPRAHLERNRVERFFNKIKHCRRIATRYETYASNFLATLKLAAVRLWLRHYESMGELTRV